MTYQLLLGYLDSKFDWFGSEIFFCCYKSNDRLFNDKIRFVCKCLTNAVKKKETKKERRKKEKSMFLFNLFKDISKPFGLFSDKILIHS